MINDPWIKRRVYRSRTTVYIVAYLHPKSPHRPGVQVRIRCCKCEDLPTENKYGWIEEGEKHPINRIKEHNLTEDHFPNHLGLWRLSQGIGHPTGFLVALLRLRY